MIERKKNFFERRKDYRLPYDHKVILSDGQRASTSYCVNISRGGIFVLSLEPFPIDTVLHMAFFLPSHPSTLCVKAKCVHIVFDRQRCEVENGMGIQFGELNESQKAIVNLYILNQKMAYLELKKLLALERPNMAEVGRCLKKLPTLRQTDLLALRYRVNRICTIFEPTPDPLLDGREDGNRAA